MRTQTMRVPRSLPTCQFRSSQVGNPSLPPEVGLVFLTSPPALGSLLLPLLLVTCDLPPPPPSPAVPASATFLLPWACSLLLGILPRLLSRFPLLTSCCDHLHHSPGLSTQMRTAPPSPAPPGFGSVGVGCHPGTQTMWAPISVGTRVVLALLFVTPT